jgi:transglutaminase-like putative cysteine protease
MSARVETIWNRQTQLMLAGVLTFGLIPHLLDIPIWATACCGVALGWKLGYLYKGWPLPSRFWINAAGIGTFAGTFASQGSVLGPEAAAVLLAVLSFLKLLETNRYQDAMFVVFTSYFLLMSALLVEQTLSMTLFMGADMLLITSLMFQLNNQDAMSTLRSLRPAMRTLALSMPIWIALFFVFPRVSGGFLNVSPNQQQTGFSPELQPGRVSNLVQDESVAFRAYFDGQPPPIEDLYWKGAILSFTPSDMKWTALAAQAAPPVNPTDEDSNPLLRFAAYQLVQEARFDRHVFPLDFLESMAPNGPGRSDRLLLLKGGLAQLASSSRARQLFDARSRSIPRTEPLSDIERKIHLQLPDDLDPRVRQLAAQLKGAEPAASMARLQSWYRENDFKYSLVIETPSETAAHFLFEGRVGFCEHYAGVSALLLRAMGHPTRVVVGYQGGQRNPQSGFITVRQLDAHAWLEIYDDGSQRWVRFDPTATIAPLRLRLGGQYYRLTSDEVASALRGQGSDGWSQWRQSAVGLFEAIESEWNIFLLDYDLQYQLQLLSQFGMQAMSRPVIVGILLVSALAFLALFYLLLQIWIRRRGRPIDPTLIAWRSFSERLDRLGVSRRPTDGPETVRLNARRHLPQFQTQIDAVVDEYIERRYGPRSANQGRSANSELHRRVREFISETQSSKEQV